MRQKFADLLRNCSRNLSLDQGVKIHAAAIKMGYNSDTMINNDLIDMYGKCKRLDMAGKVFDEMPETNVVSWTALMCSHLNQRNAMASLSLLNLMRDSNIKPNEFTFSTNFKASGSLVNLEIGMQIHGVISKSGFEFYPEVGNSIIDMYSKCGRLDEAAKMFDEMPVRSLITWNSMIAAYAIEETSENSLILFKKMQIEGETPDEFTFTSTLKACTKLGAIREGTQIHSILISRGFQISIKAIIAGALIDLYVKCGRLYEARKLFDQVEDKNKSVISWTALILGYAQQGDLKEAMDLFKKLRNPHSIRVDEFVLSSMMSLFADFALIEQGKQMHCYAIKLPSGVEISVINTILDMYLKCGLLEEATQLFDEMPEKNVVSWTVMITGYGKHGLGKDAIRLFEKMKFEKIEPDDVTYLAVLSACSHSGLVKESQALFTRLREDRRIKARVEHYACVVDLLGRAGRLQEAKKIIDEMPLRPNVGILQTLLGSCRVHKDVEMGREIGDVVLHLDGENPVNYVMLSNIYADSGLWRDCESLRETVKKKGLRKEAGRSWVEINKSIHLFYNGDENHPLIGKIHEFLREIERRMKEEMGYAKEVRFSLHDVEDESKEESLRVHSEKLAIGLALICGLGVKPIRVFKNLRVCGDCHEFIKGLSRVLNKVFVVRDANRFHKFENGLCSCGDYW